MPKATTAKSARAYVHPLAALVLNSHLKDHTFTRVRDYLRLYAAECSQLNSKALRSKTKFVLEEIERERTRHQNDEPSHSTDDAATAPTPPLPVDFIQAVHEDGEQQGDTDLYLELDQKPFLALRPVSYRTVPVCPMNWLHPIPFLWSPVPPSEWPKLLGRNADDVHPGEAPRGTFYGKPSLPFDHNSPSAYDTRHSDFIACERTETVVEVSRKIYPLNSHSSRARTNAKSTNKKESKSVMRDSVVHSRLCKNASVAVIARAILATGRFACVLPVILTPDDVGEDIPPHYGLFIANHSKEITILPLNLWFLGADVTSHARNYSRVSKVPWRLEDPRSNKVYEKFKAGPILRCVDATLASHNSRVRKGKWEPRQLSTAWDIASSLSAVRSTVASRPTLNPQGFDRGAWCWYSNIKLLADRIAGTTKQVHFHSAAPLQPFTIVLPSDFDFLDVDFDVDRPTRSSFENGTLPTNVEFEDIIADVSEKDAAKTKDPGNASRVDEKLSCVFHIGCTVHPIEGSIYCLWHHRIVAAQRPDTFITDPDAIDTGIHLRQATVALSQPTNTRWWTELRELHTMAKSFIVWIVDVEFYIVSGHNVVPWELVIRDGSTGKIILSTLVDYGMGIQDVMDELDKYNTPRAAQIPDKWRPTYRSVSGNYRGPRTTGLQLASIGDALRKAGFHTDTHRVISWWSSIDMQVFSRAIRGDSKLVSPRHQNQTFLQLCDSLGRPSLQPINFGYLIKHCTNLGHLSLGYVHRSLFDKNLEMHDAGNDTLAMYDIYQWFLTNTRDW